MSGGAFDYRDYMIKEFADQIDQAIRDNDKEDDWGYKYDYPKEVLDEFRVAVELLNKASIYVHRIDWLLSGDDGDDTFLKRLRKDLKELNNKNN